LAAKEFNEMFSGTQPRQAVKVYRSFRDQLRPHRQGIAGGFVEPELMTGCPTMCCAYTGLFEMIVGVLTTCHTQYT